MPQRAESEPCRYGQGTTHTETALAEQIVKSGALACAMQICPAGQSASPTHALPRLDVFAQTKNVSNGSTHSVWHVQPARLPHAVSCATCVQSFSTSDTGTSTFVSIVATSLVVTQLPLLMPSAFAKAAVNLVPHVSMHDVTVESLGTRPAIAAARAHFARQSAFLPTALNFAAVHLLVTVAGVFA